MAKENAPPVSSAQGKVANNFQVPVSIYNQGGRRAFNYRMFSMRLSNK